MLAHNSFSSGRNRLLIMGPSSGSRAGICWRLGFCIEMRPDTVPPSSERIWLMWEWIRPLCINFITFVMKVECVLLSARARTISLGNSCGCSVRKVFLKLGLPFSVLGYCMPTLSKASAKDCAAQISMSLPTIYLICFNASFSFFSSACLVCSARSTSTRMPRIVISNRQGNSLVSSSQMDHRSSRFRTTLKCCHNS